MPILRLIKRTRHAIRSRTSWEYSYRHQLGSLVLESKVDDLRAFLVSQWRDVAGELDMPVDGDLGRFSLKQLLVMMHFYQFFGTFQRALWAREAYSHAIRVRYPDISQDGSLTRDRIGVAIEGMEVSAVDWGRAHLGGSPSKGMKVPDRSFDSAVSGKSVIVFGPAPSEEVTQTFLGSFYVVALPKLYDGVWLGEGLRLEEHQTVVTYFNHVTLDRLRTRDKALSRVWDFARVKSVDDAGDVSLLYSLSSEDSGSVGVMRSPDRMLMNPYGPYMGPAMIFDLLLAHPGKVHVRGFTFFAEESVSYRADYDSARHSEKTILGSLRTHGAFSTFLFVKNLWRFGAMEVDDQMTDILSMTSQEYAAVLDDRFGDSLDA
jgi:hypothetical protein